jgi:hypothetical protein
MVKTYHQVIRTHEYIYTKLTALTSSLTGPIPIPSNQAGSKES